MKPRVRLIIAASLFLGWLGWLSYAAVSKSRGPVVSRAQAAATTHPVFADVQDNGDGRPAETVIIVEALSDRGPAVGTETRVVNLSSATGYVGPGRYLLLLAPDPTVTSDTSASPDIIRYNVVGQQRSPGYEMGGVGPPMIYPDSRDVRAQAITLFR